MRRIHAVVSGRVQGVGFRYWVLRKAQELGLAGWVRNLPAGEVELEAQGPDAGVATFLEYLNSGPSAARVDRVNVSDSGPHAGETGFRIE